jgi:hypothetical protein
LRIFTQNVFDGIASGEKVQHHVNGSPSAAVHHPEA